VVAEDLAVGQRGRRKQGDLRGPCGHGNVLHHDFINVLTPLLAKVIQGVTIGRHWVQSVRESSTSLNEKYDYI
jgi:hypothetical protein